MSAAQYTPGPWHIRSTGAVGTDRMMVASIYPMEDEFPEENLANACLIAAAPELLSLLIDAVESFGPDVEGGESDEWLKFARAAIAKAMGSAE